MKFKRVLIPVNLDSENLAHLQKAADLAVESGADIDFFYVNDPMAGYRKPTDREDALSIRVQEVVDEQTLSNVKVTYAVGKGDFPNQVNEYCKANSIDLIIVGHKQKGRFYTYFFDSADQDLLEVISVPVLIIPKK